MSNKTGLCYPEGGCRLNLLICDDEPAVVEQVSALLRDHCEKAASLRTFILSVIPARSKTFLPMILHS